MDFVSLQDVLSVSAVMSIDPAAGGEQPLTIPAREEQQLMISAVEEQPLMTPAGDE